MTKIEKALALINTFASGNTEKAASLLAEGRLSVMEISGMAGYENCSKFAAAFRSEYGMSPSDYRRLHRLGF